PPGGEPGSGFQPVTWWILEGQVALFGLNPFVIHLVSLVFYSANAVVLYWLTLALLRRCQAGQDCQRSVVAAIAAALAVAIHSLHPLRTEVAVWAAAQPYLPCTLFMLLTVFTYLRAFESTASPNKKLLGLTTLLFVLALLSKPLAVALPPIL